MPRLSSTQGVALGWYVAEGKGVVQDHPRCRDWVNSQHLPA